MKVIETDVVIAGAGGSGLAAAAAAAERSARVIVLEKRKAIGGNATFAEGIFASESPAQKRAAVDILNDDMFKMAMDFANWELNGALLRAFINKSGDTVRWLEEKGVKFDVLSFSPKQLHRVFHNPPRGGPEILEALIETCNRHGVQIIPGISITRILLDNKRKVTGVMANGLGLDFRINAKSVIIATGGFSGNKKLLKKYCKFDTKNSISPGLLHQGDGLNMLLEAGAASEGLGRLQMSGPAYGGNISALTAVATEPNVIWLNAKGERFTDEANAFNDFQSVNPILRQPGKFCYVLLDDKMVKTMMHEGLFRVYPGSLRPTGGPIPDLDKDFDLAQKGLKPVEQADTGECRGCGICVDLCPVGAYILEPPDSTGGKVSSCRTACPAGVDMPRYLEKLQSGKIDEAYAVLRESLPLPAVTGRICPHFCEKECARGEVDEPVNINALERFVADAWLKEKARPVPRKYKRKVAVVGSGPAGLSCAYFLTRQGYPVTVFEAQPALGGMLRLGIPEYRLPRVILDEQIGYIRDMGVDFKTNTVIGKDIAFASLKDKYDAIFFAGGNQSSRKIDIEGRGLKGVLWGLDFLKSVNLGVDKGKVDNKVVVIGGGNVAVDVALTARRMCAAKVQIACLERGDQIPAFKEELDQAIAEGIKINEGWGPQRVIGKNSKVTGIELVRCTNVFDTAGRFNPSYDEATTRTILAGTIILAIGQAPDASLVPPGIKTAKNGMVISDPLTKETGFTGVFAGGDISAGTSVVEAIADGRAAAISIDRFLKGQDLRQGREKPGTIEKTSKEKIPKIARTSTPVRPLSELTGDFNEIKTGFDHLMAAQEVRRCLTCGSKITFDMKNCGLCKLCETNCPHDAIKTTTKKIKQLAKISNDLGDIARWMGIDPADLEETLRTYNAACDDRYDPVYNKDRRYLQPLRNPPYYVFKCGTVYLTTTGGIRTNGNLEVLDNQDNVIPGLFASGNDTGGFEGSTYCVLLPGSTFGYAVNSGRIAGENAAEYASNHK